MAVASGRRRACQASAPATLHTLSVFQGLWSMRRIMLDCGKLPVLDKFPDRAEQRRTPVFQNVVTAIGETVNFRCGVDLQPPAQKGLIEHEILFSPCDQARQVPEKIQMLR